MNVSFIAMNRIIEEEMAENDAYRQQLQLNGRKTLADARRMSDQALVDKLRSLGFRDFDRDWLDESSKRYPSAQQLFSVMIQDEAVSIPESEQNWVWFALVCLWERWFPDRPNFEMIDDQMQTGYRFREANQIEKAAETWLHTWRTVQQLMIAFGYLSLQAFDDAFAGSNSVFNWVQDFAELLQQADHDRGAYARERLELSQTILAYAPITDHDAALVPAFRRALAETLTEHGDRKTADRLYAAWLHREPEWCEGWLGWSDLYDFVAPKGQKDLAKAEQLLIEGLNVPNLRDREILLDRLIFLYEETGRSDQVPALEVRYSAPDTEKADQHQTMSDHDPANEPALQSIDEIIAELDAPYTGKLPEQALRAAQARKDAMIPKLIELIQKSIDQVRAGHMPESNGHLFALFLLTEFQAKEALPIILEAISLPGDGPFDLFGDAITEYLCQMLVVLSDEGRPLFDRMIADKNLNEYVRWEAAQTYLCLVRDGRLSRDEAVQRLRNHLHDATINHDRQIVEPLIIELLNFSPHEARDEIEEAYRRNLVDRGFVPEQEVEKSLANGEAELQQALELCRPAGVRDTVKELSTWAAFQPDSRAQPLSTWPDPSETQPPSVFGPNPIRHAKEPSQPITPSPSIRKTGPKVGRNAPCPCGSGKKYKKCCGSRK